jgi:hypothetical protein
MKIWEILIYLSGAASGLFMLYVAFRITSAGSDNNFDFWACLILGSLSIIQSIYSLLMGVRKSKA